MKTMNFKWSAKQLFTGTICAGFVAAVLLIFFFIKPQVEDLSRLHELAQTRRNEYHALLIEEQSYRTARTDFAKIEDNAEIIQNLFPPKERLVGHIQALEAAAARASEEFSLSIADPEGEQPTRTPAAAPPPYTIVPELKSVEVIPYDFTVNGGFLGIIHFLQILEHQPFYSEIETLELASQFVGIQSPSEPQVRTGEVEGRIRAAFYAKKVNPEP